MYKKLAVVALIALAVVLSVGCVWYFLKPVATVVGGSGQTQSNFQEFNGGFQTASIINGVDGVETLSATATTTTLTAKQVCSGHTIIWTPSTNNTTTTLPTTASLVSTCLYKAGYFTKFQLRNASSAATFNVVAGTGQTLFHLFEQATSTGPGTTITSSTPTWYTFRITLASGTDSTAQLFEEKYLTP